MPVVGKVITAVAIILVAVYVAAYARGEKPTWSLRTVLPVVIGAIVAWVLIALVFD